LPYLFDLKDKMNAFATFSTPHLGYNFNKNFITNAGFWIFKKWYKSKSLNQLNLEDFLNKK